MDDTMSNLISCVRRFHGQLNLNTAEERRNKKFYFSRVQIKFHQPTFILVSYLKVDFSQKALYCDGILVMKSRLVQGSFFN